jgi:hypothetical protein
MRAFQIGEQLADKNDQLLAVHQVKGLNRATTAERFGQSVASTG